MERVAMRDMELVTSRLKPASSTAEERVKREEDERLLAEGNSTEIRKLPA